MHLENVLMKLGLPGKIAGDASIILLIAAVSVAFGIFMGRSRLSNFLINIYVAAAIIFVIPKSFLDFSKNSQGLIFLILVIVFNIVGTRLFDIHIPGSAPSILGRMTVLSFLEVGLTLSVFLSLLPENEVLKFLSKSFYSYFVSSNAQLIWMIVPILFLFVMNKNHIR